MFDRSNEQVRCEHCRWSGVLDEVAIAMVIDGRYRLRRIDPANEFDETVIEMVIDGAGHRCPGCQQLLRIPERLLPRRERTNDLPQASTPWPAHDRAACA